jgi:CheY-like chemotaxis protein
VLLAGRVLTAAMPGVTAERVAMAVILVVEDEVFIREIAEMMIQDWGHDTLSASDVDEALSFLRSGRHIDALFTDIYLKNSVLGGCELAHQAIELRPKLRVLYTTGNFVTDKMKALFVKGTQCLRKPYTEHQLQDCFATLLAA